MGPLHASTLSEGFAPAFPADAAHARSSIREPEDRNRARAPGGVLAVGVEAAHGSRDGSAGASVGEREPVSLERGRQAVAGTHLPDPPSQDDATGWPVHLRGETGISGHRAIVHSLPGCCRLIMPGPSALARRSPRDLSPRGWVDGAGWFGPGQRLTCRARVAGCVRGSQHRWPSSSSRSSPPPPGQRGRPWTPPRARSGSARWGWAWSRSDA